ncbi:MAG: hypothetical protein AAB131_18080 [Actinomycetota bacterium]
MDAGQILVVFRSRVHDNVAPYLWSDLEAIEFLNDAQNEAAERARLLRDSTTAEICTVAVTAGTAVYLLDRRIISVERAKLDSQRLPMQITSTPEMDGPRSATRPGWPQQWRANGTWLADSGAGWETQTGTPYFLVLDAEGDRWKATLAGVPIANDTLRLQVFRLPLADIEDEADVPEIPARLHIRLVDWMEYRAYSKVDVETQNDELAARGANAFTSAFGERIDANVRRKQQDRTPSVVQFREY